MAVSYEIVRGRQGAECRVGRNRRDACAPFYLFGSEAVEGVEGVVDRAAGKFAVLRAVAVLVGR